MKDINDLRRDRKVAADLMQALAGKLSGFDAEKDEGGADALTALEAEFDAAETAFSELDKSVKRVERVEAAQASSAQSTETDRPVTNEPTIAATAKDPEDMGIAAGMMVHALAASKGDQQSAVKFLEDGGHSAISAALSGATDAAGGLTIPRAQSQELIELLRPRVAVRASGARVVPMPAGQLRHAQQAAAATASYGAENAPSVESEPTFDKIDQDFKKLTSLVPVGNSLLRHSGIAMGALVRDDMLKVMSLREDLAFLRGDGTSNTPTGILNWTPAANWLASIAAGATAVEQALRRLVSLVEDADVAMSKPGWIMRASTKNFLASLREPSLGSYLFPSVEQSGTLLGYPIKTTSQVPNNLGAGTNETEVYFADFDEVMIGDTMQITVDMSTEATFVDTNGDTISAFQRDLTLMRAISEHDLAPRHDAALAGLNGVNWSV